jgi:outer membrane protein
MRHWLLVGLVVAGSYPGPAPVHAGALPDSTARAITLDEAIALAQENAPDVVQALGQQRTAAASVRAVMAGFLPSVSLSADASRSLPFSGGLTTTAGGQALVSEPWSFSTGLGLNVTLFDGGARILDLRKAKGNAAAAAANAVSQRYAAALAAKRSYFDVLASRESETAALAQLEQAEQQFRVSVARVQARVATRSDSLRAEIQVRNGRLAVLDARNSLLSADASLTRIVGTPYPVTAASAGLLTESGIIVADEELFAFAEDGPAMRQAQSAMTAATAARQGAWTGYLPSLSAGYSRSGKGSASAFVPGTDTYSGSFRLSLSLPIFDQLQREQKVTQAKVAEENAAALLRDARLAAREGMIQSLAAFRAAEDRVSLQSATVESAQEDLALQQQRYALGSSTLLDVMTSQTLLDQARRDLIRARYDRRIARAEIESLIGRSL